MSSPREAPSYRSCLEALVVSSPTIHPLNVRRSALWVGERPADGHVNLDLYQSSGARPPSPHDPERGVHPLHILIVWYA